jgi:hypothetical protein
MSYCSFDKIKFFNVEASFGFILFTTKIAHLIPSPISYIRKKLLKIGVWNIIYLLPFPSIVTVKKSKSSGMEWNRPSFNANVAADIFS